MSFMIKIGQMVRIFSYMIHNFIFQEFVQIDPAQTENILQFSLDSSRIAGLISPHFIPLNSPRVYVTMYEKLVQILKRDNPDLVFVLLTKV